MKALSLFVTAIVLSTILGCADQKAANNVTPDADVRTSFEVVRVDKARGAFEASKIGADKMKATKTTDGDLETNGTNIRIQKSALEKEFLWNMNLITQLTAPRFNGLKSRVVAFRLRGNELFLLEATQGHSVSNELPQTLILARFPIISQDEKSIEFDFNAGLKDLFSAEDWRASDFDGSTYKDAKEFESIPVKHSYINEVKFTSQNKMLIVVAAMLSQTQATGIVGNLPVEVRHYFSPYLPNPNYKPINTVNFDRMGFFEVAPLQNNDSVTNVYATRFDPSKDKTVTYAVSANTPAEFKAAVREGVLYWNTAFGYEKLKVVDAPEGRTAPDPEYNIVQWIPWDSAGSAYADAQMDPRTGEIQHAQVFMTSAFAFLGKSRARVQLRKLNSVPAAQKFAASITLASTPHSTMCDRDDHESLQALLAQVAVSNLSDDRIKQISQDYVRAVVAHEIGHTLGFRHNFAGTLAANFDVLEVNTIYNEYLKNNKVKDGLITSSSVMDYQFFTNWVMHGQQILLKTPAGAYDKKAVGVLYHDEKLDPKKDPLFCTDPQNSKLIGCIVWDQGPSPLANAVYNERNAIENLPQTLLEKMILAKATLFGVPAKALEELTLTPKEDAKALVAHRDTVVNLLAENAKDLKTMRSFMKIDATNEKAVKDATVAAASAEITKLGGLTKLLALPSPSLATNWTDVFNKMIESDIYKSGVGYDGQAYAFTAEEIKLAKEIAAAYFNTLQDALAKADIDFFASKTEKLFDSQLAIDYADILAERMNEYLMTESGQFIEDRVMLGENKMAKLKLPLFKYSQEVRLAAASGLLKVMPAMPEWGLVQFSSMKSNYTNKIKSILLDNDIMKIRTLKNPPLVSRWLIENGAITKALVAREGGL